MCGHSASFVSFERYIFIAPGTKLLFRRRDHVEICGKEVTYFLERK